MIPVWAVLAVVGLLVTLALALPPRRRPRPAARDVELAIYRDQLAELERDRLAGVLSDAGFAAARVEVERRLLRAARRATAPEGGNRAGRAAVLATALAVPLAGAALYATLGRPGLPDQPLAARAAPEDAPELAQIRAMVQGLEDRLKGAPEDLDGWLMLARSRLVLGEPGAAAEALRAARARAPDRPDIAVALAEALTAAAAGVVTPEARGLLAGLESEDDPRPGFYLGLAAFQEGDAHGALVRWRRLLVEAPADAPWRPRVEQAVRRAAEALGIDPEPVLAEARGRPPEPGLSAEAIRPLVESLEERLRATGGDAEGWRRLGDARRLLNEPAAAREAYGRALALLAPDHPDYARVKALVDRSGG
jgi:cytochrome c-type biogenesis protein CcmH